MKKAPTTFEDFQAYVLRNFEKHGKGRPKKLDRALYIAALGLAGECGEVVDHFKKIVRDHNCKPDRYPPKKRRELLLEFGDEFHYFVYLLNRAGFTLPEIMAANIQKLDRRYARVKSWTKRKGMPRGRR